MSKRISAPSRCPICGEGTLHASVRAEVFHPRGKDVVVELVASRCDACGEDITRGSQHDENLRRLAGRKPAYDGLLMGEELLALRRRHGLTQQATSRIFGKSRHTFSRYEAEVTYPDATTTLLLRLAIEQPEAMKWLADQAAVPLPSWNDSLESHCASDT